jgi:hypothetical protein
MVADTLQINGQKKKRTELTVLLFFFTPPKTVYRLGDEAAYKKKSEYPYE